MYNKEFLTKKQEKQFNLPQGKLIKIEIRSLYFKDLFRWMRKEVNKYGNRFCKPKFYFSSRGANFKTFYIGPINITIKRPWYKLSAQALYKVKL